jgi:formyl-CoA transferase
LRASGTVVEVPHPHLGSYLTVGSPIKFSDMTVEIKSSPLLGEHTDEVLVDLGYTQQQIEELHQARAV